MKTVEFAQAYSRPPARIETVGSRYDYRSFDMKMGDWLLYLMTLPGTEKTDPSGLEFGDHLLEEYRAYLESKEASQKLASTDLATELTVDLTLEDLRDFRGMYSQLMYEAFAAGWNDMAFDTNQSDAERKKNLQLGQLVLATQSLRLSVLRRSLADITSGYQFFQPEYAGSRHTMNGIMNELDTAVTLMGLALFDPDLCVVNSPGRFERSHNGAVNADFIAYHRQSEEIVGIQTKTTYSPEDIRSYDPDRIVLIQGHPHLKSMISTRVKPGSSEQRHVIWPGLVASDVVDRGIRLHGSNGINDVDRATVASLLRARQSAKRSLHLPYSSGGRVAGAVNDAISAVQKELYPKLSARPPEQKTPKTPPRKPRRKK